MCQDFRKIVTFLKLPLCSPQAKKKKKFLNTIFQNSEESIKKKAKYIVGKKEENRDSEGENSGKLKIKHNEIL